MTRETDPQFESLLILGGGGLVGIQVAKRAAADLRPKRIIIAGLFRKEVTEAIETLAEDHPHVEFSGYYGNVFLRGRPVPVDEDIALPSPLEQKANSEVRRQIFLDTFEDFDTAYSESLLARLIHETHPTAIVDCINTATGISYQDVFLASDIVSRGLGELRDVAGRASAAGGGTDVRGPDSAARGTGTDTRGPDSGEICLPRDQFESFGVDVEKLLVSISVPELILHVRLLYRAMMEVGSRIYIKVGTTGTGGMGLNIPYTHGEDRPSPTLMTKTAIAFAQTGLLFLMARTSGGPIVKEVKPAAMIGYRDIDFSTVRGLQWRTSNGRLVQSRDPYVLYEPQTEPLADFLDTTPRPDSFTPVWNPDGSAKTLRLPAVNTGENGTFTRGEFEAITYTGQMEFITPEEIAEDIILELRGSNTGHDVISAVDSAVMNPTYKAGMIRHVAIDELVKLESETKTPSIALGQLGPPQLAKYLYEAHLFAIEYGRLSRLFGLDGGVSANATEIASRFFERLAGDPLREVITSIGIPILHPDGHTIWRGPTVKIPPYNPKNHRIQLDPAAVDLYATKGWVDLRPSHMAWWLDMFQEMHATTHARGSKWSSERLTRRAYLRDEIQIGEVVAWIFNNKLDPAGHRIK